VAEAMAVAVRWWSGEAYTSCSGRGRMLFEPEEIAAEVYM
jgi:hypothetical protein